MATTITVTIPDDIAARIAERVEAGDFASPGALVAAAVEELEAAERERAEALEELRADLTEADEGDFVTLEEAREELRQYHEDYEAFIEQRRKSRGSAAA